jgi:(1->4)-alpha-D-glucan 1-alpha-D-glucosylmutase
MYTWPRTPSCSSGTRHCVEPMADIASTYRLQLHAGFPLAAVRALVPYLSRLGITHVHASPILQARSGSTHGYDVVDPTRLDRALGTEDDLAALSADLRASDMGLVLDIVPNHMATSTENPAWEDLLAHGRASAYARWFDVDWRSGGRGMWSRVLLPILGGERSRVLARGELRLALEARGVRLRYHEHDLPVDPSTLPQVLSGALDEARQVLGAAHPDVAELEAIIAILRPMPKRSARGAAAVSRRREQAADALQRLEQLRTSGGAAARIVVRQVEGYGSGPEGPRRLRRLLDGQVYQLVYWRRAAREINYRRFFDVNDLVALHMEDPEVFVQTHARVLDWRRRGWVDGFRIDHPDGLLDPLGYFKALVAAAAFTGNAGPPPVWAEKILSHGERLRSGWPLAGTTGYDFLNQAERLFVAPEGMRTVEREYRRILRRPLGFDAVEVAGKRLVLETAFASGARLLARRLLSLAEPAARGLPTLHATARALVEVIAGLQVYRTYIDGRGALEDEDLRLLRSAVAVARTRGRAEGRALDVVEAGLIGDDRIFGAEAEPRRLGFVQRFQQLSGPAMAKGVEDTAFYRYAALFSLNEVGGSPGVPVDSALEEFHAGNAYRARTWPASMLAVTTHDTKRTADVRARLDVLSEIPEEWARSVARWRRINLANKRTVGGRRAPDPNTVYQVLQAMVGIWPESPPAPEMHEELRARLVEYAVKAARESKERTSWTEPDEEFEAALTASIESLLARNEANRFLAELQVFVDRIARAGWWNAISRTLLQLTSPGVPDIYQGDEIWNHALVDPDNRRPVDFERRRVLLQEVEGAFERGGPSREALLDGLVHAPGDGRVKLHVMRRALHARRRRPELRAGAYHEIGTSGPAGAHVVSFGRSAGDSCTIVAVPRLITPWLVDSGRLPIDPFLWRGTAILIPGDWPRRWVCELSGETVEVADDGIACDRLFRRLPASLLLSHPSP